MRTLEDAPDTWRDLQVNGMKTDWSWGARAADYEAVLEAALVG